MIEPEKNLLLLSSSRRGDTGYLEHALPLIRDFLGRSIREVLFIPFAGVKHNSGAYVGKVERALQAAGIGVKPLQTSGDPVQAIDDAQAIMVGGGNTFCLLAALQRHKLMTPIRNRVCQGVPYIGWSAGSNIAGPTIGTTNDMPICRPVSFEALNLVPFQINPHFTDQSLDGHNGETREERLGEYLTIDPLARIVALPEGCGLQCRGNRYSVIGPEPSFLFSRTGRQALPPGSAVSP